MNVLITGSSGFVGGALTRLFALNGYTVIAGYCNNKPCFDDLSGTVIPHHVDIRKPINIQNPVDLIVHTAAGTHLDPSLKSADYIDINLNGTLNIARFATKHKVRQLVYLSAISLFGKVSETVLKEQTALNQPNMYGLSKYMGEQILKEFEPELSSVCIRLPGIVEKGYFLPWLGRTLVKLLNNEQVDIFNPNSHFNNITSPYEIYRFILKLGEIDFKGFEIVNYGAENPILLKKLTNIMIEETNSRSKINVFENDQTSFIINNDKLKSRFSFIPSDTSELVRDYCRKNIL